MSLLVPNLCSACLTGSSDEPMEALPGSTAVFRLVLYENGFDKRKSGWASYRAFQINEGDIQTGLSLMYGCSDPPTLEEIRTIREVHCPLAVVRLLVSDIEACHYGSYRLVVEPDPAEPETHAFIKGLPFRNGPPPADADAQALGEMLAGLKPICHQYMTLEEYKACREMFLC